MKTLFICSANKQRPKTAEYFFSQKYPTHEFLSAGTNTKICRKEGTTELTENLLSWADKVFVMEKKHLDQLQKYSGSKYYSKIQIENNNKQDPALRTEHRIAIDIGLLSLKNLNGG